MCFFFQLDVFKGDFEAERSAKEGLKAEKDQMAQDLQHLQRRNQQMQEEIEVLRERNFEYVPARASSRSEAHGSVNSVSLNGCLHGTISKLIRNMTLLCLLTCFFLSLLH